MASGLGSRAAAVVLATVVLLGGCGGDDDDGEGDAQPTTTVAAADDGSTTTGADTATTTTTAATDETDLDVPDDPCALLTQDQADELVGSSAPAQALDTATLDDADPAVLAATGIDAPGSDVTYAQCVYAGAEDPQVGVGVTLYILGSGRTTDFSQAGSGADVSDEVGVPAFQTSFDPQVGWVLAILDESHVLLTSANEDPELCLQAARQIVENLG